MQDFFKLDGPRYGPAAGGAPERLVILLHGLGADGNDLIGLAPQMAPHLPGALFVAPNAPYPCDMAPFGHQWFSLMDRSAAAILAGATASAPILDGFIDELLDETGLSADQTALVGFSQGTMMSLFVGPRRADSVAGILGYSGMLVGADAFAAAVRARPPIMLVHGDADEIVPVQCTPAAARVLEENDFQVETLIRPGLPHGIDQPGIDAGIRFLQQVFR